MRCVACSIDKVKGSFTNSQLKRPAGERRCLACAAAASIAIAAEGSAGPAALSVGAGAPEAPEGRAAKVAEVGLPVNPFPHSLNNCSSEEVEVVNRYGDALNASLFTARHGAVFAPTCTIHCYTGHWTQIAIGGVSMADAIGQFFAASNPDGMLWYDTCRGGNCNPTCPIYPKQL